jgi:transketolase
MKDSTYLAEMARHIRMDVLDMVFDVKDGHPGPAFSSADIYLQRSTLVVY